MKMALMVTMQIFIFAFGSDTGHYKDELESVKEAVKNVLADFVR